MNLFPVAIPSKNRKGLEARAVVLSALVPLGRCPALVGLATENGDHGLEPCAWPVALAIVAVFLDRLPLSHSACRNYSPLARPR